MYRSPRRRVRSFGSFKQKGSVMIALGVILLILALVLKINVLWTIGIILVVIGAALWILGAIGRPVGGRRYWY